MADIGCGQGTSTILMAERFPASAFTGFDHSDALIATARKAAADAGVTDRVSFEVADATSFPAGPGQGYDLVTFTDCLHDLGDPVAAAAHARSVLAPGGTMMVIEPLAADRFEDDFSQPVRPHRLRHLDAGVHAIVARPARRGGARGDGRRGPAAAGAGRGRLHPRPARRPEAAPFNIVLEARP